MTCDELLIVTHVSTRTAEITFAAIGLLRPLSRPAAVLRFVFCISKLISSRGAQESRRSYPLPGEAKRASTPLFGKSLHVFVDI
jgi:hypothetical protein